MERGSRGSPVWLPCFISIRDLDIAPRNPGATHHPSVEGIFSLVVFGAGGFLCTTPIRLTSRVTVAFGPELAHAVHHTLHINGLVEFVLKLLVT